MKNRFLFFCFLWNKLQGFLAEDGIGATRVPTGNLYSAEISTFINLDAANIRQDFKSLPTLQNFSQREKIFFQWGSFLVMVLTHIARMVLDWSVNNVKEGRNLFSYSLSRRTEERWVTWVVSHWQTPRSQVDGRDVPILIVKIMFLMNIFSFRAPSLPFLYQQNLI